MSAKSALETDRIVGVNLRIVRNQAKMSQQELGQRLGVTFQQIQKYEAGKNRISAGRLVETARAIGCKVTSLLEGIDDAAPRNVTMISADAHRAARLFDKMPPAQRGAVLKLLSSMAESDHAG